MTWPRVNTRALNIGAGASWETFAAVTTCEHVRSDGPSGAIPRAARRFLGTRPPRTRRGEGRRRDRRSPRADGRGTAPPSRRTGGRPGSAGLPQRHRGECGGEIGRWPRAAAGQNSKNVTSSSQRGTKLVLFWDNWSKMTTINTRGGNSLKILIRSEFSCDLESGVKLFPPPNHRGPIQRIRAPLNRPYRVNSLALHSLAIRFGCHTSNEKVFWFHFFSRA